MLPRRINTVCVFNRCRGKYEPLLFPFSLFYFVSVLFVSSSPGSVGPAPASATPRDQAGWGWNYKILSGKYLRDNPREMSSPGGSRRVIASCTTEAVTRSSAERTCSRPDRFIGVRRARLRLRDGRYIHIHIHIHTHACAYVDHCFNPAARSSSATYAETCLNKTR